MTLQDLEHRSWFAVRVRSNFEATSAQILGATGYEIFLPSYRARRRWSDRVKEIRLPLFPGYVFCRFDPHHRLPILKTPGVVNIVGIGKIPLPVNEQELEAVRTMVNSPLFARPWPFLKAGQLVRIEQGPLTGMEGILVEFKKGFRLVVSVTLLQRSVAAEIDCDWVRPVSCRSQHAPEYAEDARRIA